MSKTSYNVVKEESENFKDKLNENDGKGRKWNAGEEKQHIWKEKRGIRKSSGSLTFILYSIYNRCRVMLSNSLSLKLDWLVILEIVEIGFTFAQPSFLDPFQYFSMLISYNTKFVVD